MRRANLMEARLVGVQASPVQIVGAKTQHWSAHFDRARFDNAVLRGGDFHQAEMSGAVFTGADLRDCDLRGAVLRDAEFDGADLRGADLSGADTRGATNLVLD